MLFSFQCRLNSRAGCGIRLYRFRIIAILSTLPIYELKCGTRSMRTNLGCFCIVRAFLPTAFLRRAFRQDTWNY